MGSVVSGLFGGGGSTSNASEINNLNTISQGQVNLSNTDTNVGNTIDAAASPIYDTALNQYQTGVAGQLTPAQQALVTQNLGTENVGTQSTYGNLGLGGSTMEGQDLASNVLRSTAEQANIDAQNESLGLSGLQTANQYYQTGNTAYGNAGQALSGASSSQYNAGQLADANLTALNNAISSLGNKSSSGLGGGLQSLVGDASSAVGSLFGSGSAASAGTDVIAAASL